MQKTIYHRKKGERKKERAAEADDAEHDAEKQTPDTSRKAYYRQGQQVQSKEIAGRDNYQLSDAEYQKCTGHLSKWHGAHGARRHER